MTDGSAYPSRLDRRIMERRRAARRRRRRLAFAMVLLLAGTVIAGGYALGMITFPPPSQVEARPEPAYSHSPEPADQTGSPTPSTLPSPSYVEPTKVPHRGPGTFFTASGGTDVIGTAGGTLRYRVRVERDTGQDPQRFAKFVDDTLADKRSWIAGGDVRLQRVSSGSYDFTVYLATPATTDQLCAPLPTNGFTSCRQGDKVVVNLARWVRGVDHWDSDLRTYRRYVVNHEVGHRLGHGHVRCPGRGEAAPVMQQQSLKLAGCTGNAWPYVNGELLSGPPGGYA
ncbi:MAG TPA: DUF3152 domain-containing protein [Micromonosporaceae bacterium]|nr:DUF3152 domain-containing protein [Micromonosporaceae bacterium]